MPSRLLRRASLREKLQRINLLTAGSALLGTDRGARARLFQSFVHAAGATTRRIGDSGLRLAIARRPVDLMHGASGLHSQTGKGHAVVTPSPRDRWRQARYRPSLTGVAQHPRSDRASNGLRSCL